MVEYHGSMLLLQKTWVMHVVIQISDYVPKYDIFIWYIQGHEKEVDTPGFVLLGENRVKNWVSSDAKTWKYLIFKPSDIK